MNTNYTVVSWYNAIDELAPFSTAESWDNCGILVGSKNATANKALLALDITNEVVAEAAALGCELIISHHPVIFTQISALSCDSVVYKLAANGISAICAHSNLDISPVGVNKVLADTLCISNLKPLEELAGGLYLGVLGELEQAMPPQELALYVKEKLGSPGVQMVAANDEEISTVAICAGSGADFIATAKAKGAKALITGEAKHHELLLAYQLGITLIIAGHYHTENVVLKPLKALLENKLAGCCVLISQTCTDNVKFV